jgi:hypothetical protein
MVGAVAIVAVCAATATVVTREEGSRHQLRQVAMPIPPIPPIPLIQPKPSPPNRPQPKPACTTTGRPFVPTSVSLPGIADAVGVLALRRGTDGAPGSPPLSKTGKTEMAFDLGSGIRPGAGRGNVLLNAHTWPDGSALGNKLLRSLHLGDTVIVAGQPGRICYHVTDRIEVAADAQHSGYFDKAGPPRIAIAVCSGRRLGPGRWTKRTLWFASPTRPAGPAG